MASKMRLFLIIQNMYRMTGINTTPQSTPNSLLNWKIGIVLISHMLLLSSTAAFFLFKANSVTEYGSAFSGSVMILTNMLYFILNILQMPTTIELIEKFEDFIEKREYNLNELFWSSDQKF